jgi:hypothetical protein
MAAWLATSARRAGFVRLVLTRSTVAIKPEALRRIYWTKVLIDPFVSVGATSGVHVSGFLKASDRARIHLRSTSPWLNRWRIYKASRIYPQRRSQPYCRFDLKRTIAHAGASSSPDKKKITAHGEERRLSYSKGFYASRVRSSATGHIELAAASCLAEARV